MVSFLANLSLLVSFELMQNTCLQVYHSKYKSKTPLIVMMTNANGSVSCETYGQYIQKYLLFV